MSEFSSYRILSEKSDEYRMLIDVADEFNRQEGGSTTQRSGNATLNVISKYLIGKGFKLPQDPKVTIQEVKSRMNLLYLLKSGIPNNKSEYSVKDVNAVLKIVNNAVGERYNDKIKNRFLEFRSENPTLRFAVVVLSENSVFNPYKHCLKEDNFSGIAELFTLIFRENAADELYFKNTIERLSANKELRKPHNKGLEDITSWLSSN
jgi:hypothetical protein